MTGKGSILAVWSSPLPRPITIPQVMTLRTLADVRKLRGFQSPPATLRGASYD